MYKYLIIAVLLTSFANAQTKTTTKPTGGKKVDKAKLKADSIAAVNAKNTVGYVEVQVPHSFFVYTKRPKTKEDKFQLCYNLVSNGTELYTCFNDSICKDPEVTKLLFEKQVGDTNYVLIYVDAFSKSKSDGGVCNAGKETKLSFVRWNTKTNLAKWKHKNINSCLKTITNMTKEPILDWDKASVLTINYHRGTTFYEFKFDPQNPQLGFQSANDNDSK
jgi:hypothetical protein